MERKKLELEINKPAHVTLLYDEPIVGESQYGKYYLYAVRNGDGSEYSYFASPEVHDTLRRLRKNAEVEITKIAAQRGKKLVTTYDVKIIKEQNEANETSSLDSSIHNQGNPYLESMLQSFADAIKVQEKFNGMANVNQLAVTIFISRIKANGL